MRKQSHIFRLRCNPEDVARWKTEASSAGLSLADLVRTKLDSALVGRDPIRRRPTLKADPLLLATLGRAANNLNQIAKWANTHKSGADAVQVVIALRAIEQELAAHRPVPPEVKNADPSL